MNKDEMIKDLTNIQKNHCDNTKMVDCMTRECNDCMVIGIINAGYRKVGEDEIVVKKSEYENLSKTYAAINSEAYYCGLSVGREEVAKEILQELYDEAISYVCKVVELTTFQIEQRAKEKGIELEKDNGQR